MMDSRINSNKSSYKQLIKTDYDENTPLECNRKGKSKKLLKTPNQRKTIKLLNRTTVNSPKAIDDTIKLEVSSKDPNAKIIVRAENMKIGRAHV